MSKTVLLMRALGTIKGIAGPGDEFKPADHALGAKDTAELVACGAAEVLQEGDTAAELAAPGGEPAAPGGEPAALGGEPVALGGEPAEPAEPGAADALATHPADAGLAPPQRAARAPKAAR